MTYCAVHLTAEAITGNPNLGLTMASKSPFRSRAVTILRKLWTVDRSSKLARLRATPIPIPPQEFITLVSGRPTSEEFHAQVGLHLFELLRDRCGLQRSSTVLDIGCGCGRVATPLTDFLTDGVYHGVDIVQPMIKWCQKNITVRYPNFCFHHADLANTLYSARGQQANKYVFPFRDETFDVIFASSVFTHLIPASAHQYAREISRLLKPRSGRALVTFFLTNEAVRARQETLALKFAFERDGYIAGYADNPEACLAYEESVARRMLEDASLTIEHLSLGQWSQHPGWTGQDAFLLSTEQRNSVRSQS
jgi:SAM-dependent methyltransferase